MIANTWYCIAKTSTFDTGCTINVAFEGYSVQFSASVKYGLSAINVINCNLPYDVLFSIRLRESGSEWFVDIYSSKEVEINVTIADNLHWTNVNTSAGEGNIILILNDISSKFNTGQGGTGGFDVNQLRQFLLENGYTALLDYWTKDKAHENTIRTRYNVIADGTIAMQDLGGGGSGEVAQGNLDNLSNVQISNPSNGDVLTYDELNDIWVNKVVKSGLDETELKSYLTTNQYAKLSDIPSLDGYALASDLTALRTDFDKLNTLLNGNVGGVIDTWNEVVSFLDGYSQSDDLATILSGMNSDIANRVLIEDFEKLEGSVTEIAGYFTNGSANNALKLGGQLPSYYATADALNGVKNDLTSVSNRVKKFEDIIDIDKNGDVYIKGTRNFYTEGGTISMFGLGEGDSGEVASVSIKFEGSDDVYSAVEGIITLPAYPSGGGVADSVAWSNVTGKPTTLEGYGITDALPLSGGTLNSNKGIGFKAYMAISGGGGWTVDVLNLYDREMSKRFGGLGYYGDSLNLSYIYLGANAYNGNNLRIYADNIAFGESPILTTANYANYALPLSGGVLNGNNNILTINGINNSYILFNLNMSARATVGYYNNFAYVASEIGGYARIGIADNGEPQYWTDYTGNTKYALIHSGNIGSQSVNYANSANYSYGLGVENAANVSSELQYMQFATQNDAGDLPTSDWWHVIKMGHGNADTYFNRTLAFSFWNNRILTRNRQEGIASDWEELAFLSSNVASATKLQTGRYLWGNYFNGESDVNGKPFFKTSSADTSINVDIASIIVGPVTSNRSGYSSGVGFNGLLGYGGYDNHLHGWIGLNGWYSGAGAETYALVFAVNDNTNYGSVLTERMRITPNGNVLIGTTTDWGAKLTVEGSVLLNNIYFGQNQSPALGAINNGTIGLSVYNAQYGLFSWTNGWTGDSYLQTGRTDGNTTAYQIILNPLGGNVLIGTTSNNGHKLQVAGAISLDNVVLANTNSALLVQTPSGASWFGMKNEYYCHIYTDAPSFYLNKLINVPELYCLANMTVAGNLYLDNNLIAKGTMAMGTLSSSSDARLKDNIELLTDNESLAVLRQLRPSKWNWKSNGALSYGFIAQEVESVASCMVDRMNDEELGQKLYLQYNQLHAFEVGAIQHIDSEVETLKRRVNELENELKQYRLCQ